MTDARDLLAEIDATLKLGRERHLDFRVRAFDLLVRLRPLVERDADGGLDHGNRSRHHGGTRDEDAGDTKTTETETGKGGGMGKVLLADAKKVTSPDGFNLHELTLEENQGLYIYVPISESTHYKIRVESRYGMATVSWDGLTLFHNGDCKPLGSKP